MSKLRVLCLHGYRQNGETLRGRIAAYRRAFKSSVEFVPRDPVVVTNDKDIDAADDTQMQQLSWYNFQLTEEEGRHVYSNVTEAIDYISTICREQGPFHGVFGFSQGGAMASILLQLQQAKQLESPFAFSFGIFVAAPAPRDPEYQFCTEPLVIPSLHIMGTTDAVVEIEKSRALAESFQDAAVFEHAGGHYIPANKDPKDAMRAFIKAMQDKLEVTQ